MEEAVKNSFINLLKWIFLGITKNAYFITLFVCLVSIIFYMAGCKRAGKYISYSIITYLILECLKGLIEWKHYPLKITFRLKDLNTFIYA